MLQLSHFTFIIIDLELKPFVLYVFTYCVKGFRTEIVLNLAGVLSRDVIWHSEILEEIGQHLMSGVNLLSNFFT